MDFVSVCQGDKNSHKIISESLKRNKPISGHIFGRSFVAAYAASGITDTHESEEKNFTSDLLDSGLWIENFFKPSIVFPFCNFIFKLILILERQWSIVFPFNLIIAL